jgi:tryptophan synthase alpha chain
MPGNRIDAAFARLRDRGQAAFVAYVCAGDPSLAATRDIVLGLESAGVDIVELGLPFSDPLADGIVNQLAAQRALEAGATAAGTLALVREIRESSQIPLVLFTYLNPVYAYGFDRFHTDAAAAGVDGVLLLDLPPDEAAANPELTGAHGLKQIRLIAPTTPPDRMRELGARAEGFVYYVSREGVTGAQATLAGGIAENVALIKSATRVPVCVGFGISTPDQAAAVARSADGVVVGSAIVKIIEAHGTAPDLVARVTGFVRPLVEAVKSA